MPMTSGERDFALRQLAESRDRLLRTVQGLAREQLRYKPAPDRWSVAENLEHILLVERRAFGLVDMALRQAATPERRSGFPGDGDSLIKMLRDRSHPRRGPEQIQPKGQVAASQALAEFEQARKRTCDFLASTPADLHAYFVAHALFGDLSCYQWMLVMASHCDRHCAQIQEVMASAGFPKAAAAV